MIPIAALTVARTWWKLGAGAILGAALALPVGQCQGRGHARGEMRTDVAEANARAQAANAALIQAQAAQREADAAKTATAAKGRSDAIHAGPDALPSRPECRLQRQRLLNAGAREADLPACR